MIKQYVVEPAYTDYYTVRIYIDGEQIGYEIIPYWEMTDYCNRLKTGGYTEAYNLDVLWDDVINAKDEYETALRVYENAKHVPLIKKKNT